MNVLHGSIPLQQRTRKISKTQERHVQSRVKGRSYSENEADHTHV